MAETRITAGEWRGRVITTPKGVRVRPTRGIVRQAIFNILGQNLGGWRVVDLYAGVGSVGFEALSRGAQHVTFVERHAPTGQLIVATAARFGCSQRVTLAAADSLTWLRHNREAASQADLVFVDAPYGNNGLIGVLECLGDVAPALVVCEHHVGRELPAHPGRLIRTRTSVYGLNAVSFFGREGEQGEREGGALPGQL